MTDVTESMGLGSKVKEVSSIYMGGSSAIGDTVWHAFVVTALRERYPDARISLPTPGAAADVIEDSVAVTSLDCVPKASTRRLDGHTVTILPEEWHLLEPGSDTELEICLPTVKFYRSQGIESAEESPHVAATGQLHVVDAYLERVRETIPDLPLVDAPWMPSLDTERQNMMRYLDPAKQTVTINTGTSMQGKNYPIEKWLDVADELVAAGSRVILLGGKGDPAPPLLWRVRRPDVVVLVGKLSLRNSMALISLGDLHLSGDTGTGHIAAAYRVPTLTLFGTMSFPEIGRPYGTGCTVLQSDEPSPAGLSVMNVVSGALEILEK